MIKPRNRGKGRPQVACIACLYSCGFGAKRIGAIVHYSHAAVTKAMHRHGLPILSSERRKCITNQFRRKTLPHVVERMESEQFGRNVAKAIRHSRSVFEDDIKAVERLKTSADYVARYHSDPAFMIKARLRRRLRKVVESQGTMKRGSTIDLIGCSSAHIKSHIESQFKDGMAWDNHGLWHIDHIRPCSSFDLTREDAERSAAFFFLAEDPRAVKGGDWALLVTRR